MKVVAGALWGSALALLLGTGLPVRATEEDVPPETVVEEILPDEVLADPVDEPPPPSDEEFDPNVVLTILEGEEPPAEGEPPTEGEEPLPDEEVIPEDPPMEGEEVPPEPEEVLEDIPVVPPLPDDPTTPEDDVIFQTTVDTTSPPENVSETPEPGTLVLAGMGASLAGWFGWRRRRNVVGAK